MRKNKEVIYLFILPAKRVGNPMHPIATRNSQLCEGNWIQMPLFRWASKVPIWDLSPPRRTRKLTKCSTAPSTSISDLAVLLRSCPYSESDFTFRSQSVFLGIPPLLRRPKFRLKTKWTTTNHTKDYCGDCERNNQRLEALAGIFPGKVERKRERRKLRYYYFFPKKGNLIEEDLEKVRFLLGKEYISDRKWLRKIN